MIDLTKLTPAPWKHVSGNEASFSAVESGDGMFVVLWQPNQYDLEFIALARNAFDVMMRRGWGIVLFPSGWTIAIKDVSESFIMNKFRGMRWPDPFTALVEADAWYMKNIGEA